MQPTSGIEAILPLFAALISYGIQREHWPASANASIAGSSIILVAILTVFLHGGLTSNIAGDVVLIAGATMALQAKELAPLQEWLKGNFPVNTTPQPPPPSMRQPLPPLPPTTGSPPLTS